MKMEKHRKADFFSKWHLKYGSNWNFLCSLTDLAVFHAAAIKKFQNAVKIGNFSKFFNFFVPLKAT